MKNTFSCILIVHISFAYNYETIKYPFQLTGSDSITWNDDFQGEGKGPESEEEPTEENTEVNFSDDLYYK